jgi:predicted glutamine amidotransferase
MFGMLSLAASNARKYLLEDSCSLYVQSNVNKRRPQADGWGIGFYVGRVPHLVKSEKPVYEEHAKFTSAVHNADSHIILAHIRRASNPRRLPRDKIISVANSQPFMHENYLFAHNGVITIPDDVAETIGEWKYRIKGFNDSEVYFWFAVKEMLNGASFPEALKKFENTLSELWQKNREKHSGKNRPYIGLNVLFSDGEKLCAYCKYGDEDAAAKSLCFEDQPAFQMSYLKRQENLIVASEKTNCEDDWKPLETGQLLTGQIMGKNVSVNVRKIT